MNTDLHKPSKNFKAEKPFKIELVEHFQYFSANRMWRMFRANLSNSSISMNTRQKRKVSLIMLINKWSHNKH
jgi:hypothetical protein